MPQMMPIYWVLIMIFNILILIMVTVLINSIFNFKVYKINYLNKNNYNKNFPTKWM
uniref:ATP synthase F0 subunit 8 n=1 Tax=Lepidotrigona flavibasis TaxID=2696055 RepID=A0A6B9MYU4_9HYME|nr:ATP synthase F0 subunit 8 [Lepidotrigona flavibasis]